MSLRVPRHRDEAIAKLRAGYTISKGEIPPFARNDRGRRNDRLFEMSDLRYWLALNFVNDIGPVLTRRLLSAFGNPENIFGMTANELVKVEGIGENKVKGIIGFREWDRVDREIDRAAKNKANLITMADKSYPQMLRHLPDAPIVLYVKGEIRDDDKYAIAMVGSRLPTDYGLSVAEKMSSAIASYGLTVVSGMARGIDAASHRGALKAGGRTIAVLGSGIDMPYPPENRGLMDAIASSGAVVTEFPLGTPPDRENFPRRNRIISALSFGVLVIEATVDSGSLITANYALEQGKTVFAVPGNITSATSRGTNDLIKRGARLIEEPEEIIDDLRPQIKGILREAKKALPPMADDEKTLCSFLSGEPKHIDLITRESGISTSEVLSILLRLELKGIVRQANGKKFSLNW